MKKKELFNITEEDAIEVAESLFFTRGNQVKYNFIEKDFCDNIKTYGYQDMIDIISYTKTKIHFDEILDSLKIPF